MMKDKSKLNGFFSRSQRQENPETENGNMTPSLDSFGALRNQMKFSHPCQPEKVKHSVPLLYSRPILETEQEIRVNVNERVGKPEQEFYGSSLRNKKHHLLHPSSLLNQVQQEMTSNKMTGFPYTPLDPPKFADEKQVASTPLNDELSNLPDDEDNGQVFSFEEEEIGDVTCFLPELEWEGQEAVLLPETTPLGDEILPLHFDYQIEEEKHPIPEQRLPIEKEPEPELETKSTSLEQEDLKENDLEPELLLQEGNHDNLYNTMLSESANNKIVETEHKYTVKVPVLLAEIKPNIDIKKTLYLPLPIEHVSKVDWSIKSFDCIVAVPSTVVFLKGELRASIEYKSKGMTCYHVERIAVEMSKDLKVTWLSPPRMPFKKQQEYMFSEYGDGVTSSHHEYIQQYTDPIITQLQNVHFTSYETFYIGPQITEMIIIGELTLAIALLQEQFLNLGSMLLDQLTGSQIINYN